MKFVAGQYIQRNSFVHSLHPITKLLALLIFTIFVVVKGVWMTHIAGVLLLISGTFAARIEIKKVGQIIKLFWVFLLLTFLIHLLFTPGAGGVDWFIFHISPAGVNNGLLYSLRVFLLVWAASLFGWTTSPVALGDSVETLFAFVRVFGVSPRDISTVFVLSMRFIPTLFDDARQILWAQRARGVRFSGSIKEKVKNIIPLVIPLFVVAFRRADKLALALLIRGYDSALPRTKIIQIKFSCRDFVFLAFLLIFLAVIQAIAVRMG